MECWRRHLLAKATVPVWLMGALLLISLGVRAQQPSPARPDTPSAGDAERGKQLFATLGCAGCHGQAGEGGTARTSLRTSSTPLAAFIRYTRAPTGTMPHYDATAASDAQLTDIYAFLRTAPASAASDRADADPGGNAENGRKLYMEIGCWQCHGYSAQGGRAGPRLAPNPLAFGPFAGYVRAPGGEMPPYTTKVLSDAELADIYAFLKTFPPTADPKDIPLLNKPGR